MPYGEIEAIKAVSGVEDVVLETRYEPAVVGTDPTDPNMATSSSMIGSSAAWAEGYTGAGSRIAISGVGPDQPVASNSTAEGKAQNRRVTITLTPTA